MAYRSSPGRLSLALARLASLTGPLVLVVACADDATDDTKGGIEAGAGTGGSGTGGASGSGGASTSGGATGAGGFDPALALECGADAGSNDCRLCLAVKCCEAYAKCMRDPICVAGFEEYQSCYHDPATVEPQECFATFARDLVEMGGEHSALPTCVITSCLGCGGPPLL